MKLIDSYTKETIEAKFFYFMRLIHREKSTSTLKRTVAALTAAVLITGMLTAGVIAEPYAYTCDGEKISEIYTIKAGEKQLAYVESEKQGKEVIKRVEEHYLLMANNPQNINVSPEIRIEKTELETGVHPTLESAKKTKDRILNKNVITVSCTDCIKKTETIKHKTVVKTVSESPEKKVKKGHDGERTITAKVTYENGIPVSTKVLKKKVTKKAKNKIIYRSETNAENSNEKPVKSISGQKLADYAVKFVGNPYVYGGTSLTEGTDCSGFVMLVYAHFGVNLPHSANALRNKGYGVSYENAKPGDILCFDGHCGIYLGNGRMIHAADPSQGIVFGSATQQKIYAVRRIAEK